MKLDRLLSITYYKNHSDIKKRIELKNQSIAINTLTIPIIIYSFNKINRKLPEIKKIDTKVWKLIPDHRIHHSRTYIEDYYTKRENRGKSLMQQELTTKTTSIG